MMFHHCLTAICIAGLLTGNYVGAKKTSKKSSSFKIVCYYGNWAVYRQGLARFTPQNINPYLCTHIIYAFGGFNNDFELKPFDKYNDIEQGNYRKFTDLKKYNPRLKAMLAIGGWNEGSARFSRLVGDSDNREIFVKSVIRFLRNYDFDGLDMDWEYPTFRDGSSLDDREGYVMLIQELRQAFNNEVLRGKNEKLLLSMAVPAGQDYIDQGFDMLEISKNVDFLNLLTYDFHTSYEPTANHHSPLYQRPNLPDEDYRANLNVDWTVRYYIQLGVAAFKIIVGIPTYGRGYTLEEGVDGTLGTPVKGPGDKGPATKESGYMAYYEICRKIKEDGWIVEKPYPNDVGPYAFKGDQWVGFDDEETVMNKAKYIKDKHLGGAMFWSLDNDDFRGQCGNHPNPLITAVRSVLLGKTSKGKKKTEVKPKKKVSDNSIPSAAASTNTDSTIPKSSISRRSTTRFPKFQRTPKVGRTVKTTTVDDEVDEDEVEIFNTPPTPATPDPGPAFECKDSGFYQNPTDCKKYFWCLDSGPANLGLVAHAFTCPSGLYFNKRTDACDYPTAVVCKADKPPETTTSATKIDAATKATELADLLSLIKQLGGLDGVQKFIKKGKEDEEEEEEEEATTTTKKPTTKKPTPKRTTTKRTRTTTTLRPKSKKPRRTTVRTTTTESDEEEEEEEVELSTTTFLPKTTVRKRSKGDLFDEEDDGPLFSTTRSRGKLFDNEEDNPVTPKLTRNYITIQRTTTAEPSDNEEESETTTTTTEPTTTTTTIATTTRKRRTKAPSTKPSLFRTTGIRLRTFTKSKKKDDEEEEERLKKKKKEEEERMKKEEEEKIKKEEEERMKKEKEKKMKREEEERMKKEEERMKKEEEERMKKEEEEKMKKEEEEKMKKEEEKSSRKMEEEKRRGRKGEEESERKVKPRKGALKRIKVTTSPPTTTEIIEKIRSSSRRLPSSKLRPQISSKDFETTGSRVSTTIQKAPRPFSVEEEDDDDEEEDEEVSDTSNGVLVSTPLSLQPLDEVESEVTKSPLLPFYTTHFMAGNKGVSIPTLPSLPSISFPTSFTPINRFSSTPATRLLNITRRYFSTTPLPAEESLEYEDQEEAEAKDIDEDDEEYIEVTARPSLSTLRPRPISTHKPIVRTTSRRPVLRITTTKPSTRRPAPVFKERVTIPPTPETIIEYIDEDGDGEVSVDDKGRLECDREGIYEHPIACNKFVNCVRTANKLRPWTYTCPPGLLYDNNVGHCNWEEQVDCGDKKRK